MKGFFKLGIALVIAIVFLLSAALMSTDNGCLPLNIMCWESE